MNRETNYRKTDGKKDKWKERQMERKTDKHMNRKKDGHIDRLIERQRQMDR